MEGVIETSPAGAPPDVSLYRNERSAALGEAMGLVVDNILAPLTDQSVSTQFLASILPDQASRAALLQDASAACRESFKVREMPAFRP